jgi:hypothetical protein
MQDCSEGVMVSNNGAQLVTGLTCKTVQRVLW